MYAGYKETKGSNGSKEVTSKEVKISKEDSLFEVQVRKHNEVVVRKQQRIPILQRTWSNYQLLVRQFKQVTTVDLAALTELSFSAELIASDLRSLKHVLSIFNDAESWCSHVMSGMLNCMTIQLAAINAVNWTSIAAFAGTQLKPVTYWCPMDDLDFRAA